MIKKQRNTRLELFVRCLKTPTTKIAHFTEAFYFTMFILQQRQ